MKEYRCECCGNTEWMGKPIALELHHVNGIKDDLRVENLQLLCPNCHAFTDNYRGKNIGKDGTVSELVYETHLKCVALYGIEGSIPFCVTDVFDAPKGACPTSATSIIKKYE